MEHDGNPVWLNGLEHVPRKIRSLFEINKILAHRPWLVTKEDIRVCTQIQNCLLIIMYNCFFITYYNVNVVTAF